MYRGGGDSFSRENYQLKTYTNLSQIDLVVGEETIEDIGANLPIGSQLTCTININNADIYPTKYAMLKVTKSSIDRIVFELVQKQGTGSADTNTATWYGFGFFVSDEFHWTGWIENAKKSDLSNYVPVETTVNGKTLDKNISLAAEDVGAIRCVNITGKTLKEVLDYNSNLGQPYMFETAWNNTVLPTPDNNQIIGIVGRKFIFGFNCRNGKIYYANSDDYEWRNAMGGYLPLDSSVAMTGNKLEVASGGYFESFRHYTEDSPSNHYNCFLQCPSEADDTTDCSRLLLAEYDNSKHKLLYQLHSTTSSWSTYDIFSSYSKPMGSYVGNGSSTQWTIELSRTVCSLACLIIGGGALVVVSLAGGFGYKQDNGGTILLSQTEIKYHQGTLTVATANSYVNKNGQIYYYQFL